MKVSERNRIDALAKRADAAQPLDSKSKDFQNQIANEKNRLKDLKTDSIMNEEEKEKKRKEIQQKIAELNKQLRQHQIELRREWQNQKEASDISEDKRRTLEKDQKETEEESKESYKGQKAIVSANTAFGQARAQGNTVLALEGKVRILQSEIHQDELYGKDTKQKQEELKKLEKKAVKVKGAKMSYLSRASKEMKAKENKPGEASVKQTHSDLKKKTDVYIKGNMFSNVEFHF